jgi:hypothetical protein
MNKRAKVCLFTAFSPAAGGGGTNLRSILPDVQKSVEIAWLYTAGAVVPGREDGWVGLPAIGGENPLKDFFRTSMILGGKPSRRIEEIVTRLLAVPCDAYWVVSHNEGLRVALELCQRSERPVHLTIQDDWAGALCARSKRYKALAPLARRMSDRTIKAVSSIDVTSEGMRKYYKQRAGVDSAVIHPVIPEHLPAPVDQFACDKVTVGHAGSLYAIGEFLTFAKALAAFARHNQRTAEIRMWGPSLAPEELPEQIREMVTIHPACEEQELVGELARCHFLYAMYPFSRSLRIFARTSLPTKLSTYVQSQRPILGHGPAGSTLASFLQETQTGITWSNAKVQDGVRSITSSMQLSVERRQWEQARDVYYGEANAHAMLLALDKLTEEFSTRLE